KIDPKLPKVLFGDDMRIKQVITNILSNAVKYTEEGTVTLTMSGEVVDDDNLILFVSVEDTGIGIREEDIEKLFQSFIRLDETKNKNIEGTGLGISIVKELLRMMNSRLEVSSVYGKGSDFSFRLPQKIIDKTPVGIYGEHHSDRKLKRVETRNFIKAPAARILAVDDMNMNLKVINGLLKRNLIVPDLADSGEQCLQFAEKYFYHIIFLDHMMPKMDGVETLKRLKAINLPPETKIIMLTANAISGARERYLAKGFDDYLSKPINVDDLEAILAKYLPPEIILEDDGEPTQAENGLPSINMEVALSNCMDSEDFFAEMVEEFINSDKTAELNAALTAEDLAEYRIAAHALKGTALVIGAVQLSDKAKAQEQFAKDGRLDDVKKNHGDLIAAYKKVLDELRTWLKPEDDFRRRFESSCPSIDLDTALSNCMDSEDFFAEMVDEFISSDKTDDLNAALATEDLAEYRVAAHALKGTALVIGAVKLSDKAKTQELAAKDGRLDDLKRNHDDFIQTYKKVLDELGEWRRDTQCKKS
ncbi:MAG: response regulator, partial [Selenomonadaceae bacterium]|nr:response regulator [Selenomonadaceae bacterium]